MMFLTIEDGKFEVYLGDNMPGYNVPDYATANPEKLVDWCLDNDIEDFMCSSSVDSPSDYGMNPATVDRFWEIIAG